MDSAVMYNPFQEDQIRPGIFLLSQPKLYVVESILGHGAYGTVAKCTSVNDMKTVAIKFIKDFQCGNAFLEMANLDKISKLDPDKCNIVRWYGAFVDRGYFCLEFEKLDKSLYHLLKERNHPFQLNEIRPIVQQLANALHHLMSIQIIHADLKLDNVMLVNHKQAPFKIKLIDFGLAYDRSAVVLGSYAQTRFYRAPEVMLGLPFNEAIDMWSLGCVAVELFLGTPLYPGSSSYNMMRYIVETQEMPPDSILDSGMHTEKYFQKDLNTNLWSLKTPGINDAASWQPRLFRLNSLDDILHIWPLRSSYFADVLSEVVDLVLFLDVVKAMLQLDASHRITPQQALSHPFTSMSFFPNGVYNNYTWSSIEIMERSQDLSIGNSDSTSEIYQQFILDSPLTPDTFLNQFLNPDLSTTDPDRAKHEP